MAHCAELWDQAARYRRLLGQTTDDATRLTLEQTIRDLEQQATECLSGTTDQQRRTMREFYASENGDMWLLAAGALGMAVVVHQANQASDGMRTEVPVEAFLTTHRRHTPEHQALLQLIASVINRA